MQQNADAPSLYIHRTQMDGDGYLRQIYLGPETLVTADYERLRVLRFWIPLAILVSTLPLSVIMIVLFLLRRREPVYGWYAVMMIFWAIYQFWNVTYLPLTESAFVWRAISYASLGLFVIAVVFFVHRFLNRRPVILERLLQAWFYWSSPSS